MIKRVKNRSIDVKLNVQFSAKLFIFLCLSFRTTQKGNGKCRLFIGALVRGNNQLRYGHNLWGHSLYVPVSEIQTRGPQWMR